jgi:choline kinase
MYVACLMAGMSSRLLPLTENQHKAMLSIGTLQIIDAQMKSFALAALDKFSFVVGHGGSQIASHLLSHYPTLAFSIINNNYYAQRNLDWSAYLALNNRDDDVIYYEGDIILSPSILQEVIAHEGDVCVVMDPAGQSARVDTRVIAEGNRACGLIFSEHGDLPKGEVGRAEGEFVCLAKLSDRARRYVVSCLQQESYVGPMKLYQIFDALFQRYPSFVVSTAGRPWIEIDNNDDLLRASSVVNRIFGS